MIRAFQWDLARQVERLDWLLAQLPKYAAWGYTELYLHLEDAVDYPSLPGVARDDAYSWQDFERLVTTAREHGIGVVPIANLLGHTQYLIKCPEWRDLNELRHPDGSPQEHGQICLDLPGAADIAQRLVNDLAPLCTAGRLHVGLDESFLLGKHPVSAAAISKLGRARYFADYVQQLHALVDAQGLQMGIWGDMLALLPEAIPHLPAGIAVYDWYYHGFRRHPRFELYNFAEYNIAPTLAARDIDYWACPMNGAFRHECLPLFGDRLGNAVAWWRRAQRVQAKGFLVTSWEANHLTPEITTVIDAAIAGLWLDQDEPDHATLLRRGLERAGLQSSAAAEARLALSCDIRPFAGYARAERNLFWDTAPPREGSKTALAEARFYARAAQRSRWPALQCTLAWRHYLAERESFVRQAMQSVLRARQLQRRGKFDAWQRQVKSLCRLTTQFREVLTTAPSRANALWSLTRDEPAHGANRVIADTDIARLAAWEEWLQQVQTDPKHTHTSSPIAGVWQLCLTVHATRPNANIVVVQQQDDDGSWRDLRQRHTIEFRSIAARRRSTIKQGWSIPIEDPERPLRIALRGVGEVAISQVILTNGIETRHNQTWPRAERRPLGQPAVTAGWPELDWARNTDSIGLEF